MHNDKRERKLPAPTCSTNNKQPSQLQSQRSFIVQFNGHPSTSEFRHCSCRGCSGGILRGFVHGLGPSVSEDGTDRWQARGDQRAFTDPVVVHVTVDGSDVVGEVDVDGGDDHGEEGEEEGVCDINQYSP